MLCGHIYQSHDKDMSSHELSNIMDLLLSVCLDDMVERIHIGSDVGFEYPYYTILSQYVYTATPI